MKYVNTVAWLKAAADYLDSKGQMKYADAVGHVMRIIIDKGVAPWPPATTKMRPFKCADYKTSTTFTKPCTYCNSTGWVVWPELEDCGCDKDQNCPYCHGLGVNVINHGEPYPCHKCNSSKTEDDWDEHKKYVLEHYGGYSDRFCKHYSAKEVMDIVDKRDGGAEE